ncbi:hypothetical protein BO83DRAFT_418724 [Aspergillus eucalypticola CBS 122712]|uniref:Heterokaryon incompatibility domain-containing protein n=1 Tax=Aspergillus eucalypticola (strain CBS 122712 / IBT 29274) TaxID=1448314 RepID=A0A317V7M8_ASPEC|nr:uncharacterized protein BO83DRAFT_418724 [Aspergillus eucalypticola CBS 122712]PWY68842.1 hypothetical protein BO83DRAFT_418724 [Aspergillus eucalypticola CBS 122712]
MSLIQVTEFYNSEPNACLGICPIRRDEKPLEISGSYASSWPMDHLPSILSSMRASPQVPYLDYQPRYDGSGFDAFPSRCGIDTDKLQRGDLGAHTVDSIMPFLQEWLFFGLLQEVFEVAHVSFRREDSVAKATAIPGQQRISTANLPKYLWSWTANTVWARDTFGEFDHQKRRVAEVLKLSNLCLNAVIRLQAAHRGTEPATGPVLLSIAIVGEALDVERDTVFISQREEFYGTLTWELPEFGRKLLMEAGYCTGEVKALRRDFPSVSSLYYLATWDRSTSKANHSQCAETCLARQVDEKTYATKHTGEGCSCLHLPIDMTAIFKIVDQRDDFTAEYTDDVDIYCRSTSKHVVYHYHGELHLPHHVSAPSSTRHWTQLYDHHPFLTKHSVKLGNPDEGVRDQIRLTHPEADRDYIDSPYQSLFIAVKAALALANTDAFTQVFSICGIHEEHCQGPFPPVEKVMVENRSSVYHFHARGNLSQRLVIIPEILLDGVFTEPDDVDTQRQQSALNDRATTACLKGFPLAVTLMYRQSLLGRSLGTHSLPRLREQQLILKIDALVKAVWTHELVSR